MTVGHPPAGSPLTGVSVQEAMHPGVVSCPPDAALANVAAAMVTHSIHALLLSTSDPSAPLMVTDLDLARAAIRAGGAQAGDMAREPVTSIASDAPLEEAVSSMAVHYVAHLLVNDPVSGDPVGVLSSFDIAAVLGGWLPRLARMARPAPARPMVSASTLRDAVIRDVMHPGVATCPPEAPVCAVARIMAERHVHCVAVAGIDTTRSPGPHLMWGLLDDMDLVVTAHRGELGTPAASVAGTNPIAIHEGASLDHAAALMVHHETSHIVVVGPSGLPSGIVSTLEVARVLAATG